MSFEHNLHDVSYLLIAIFATHSWKSCVFGIYTVLNKFISQPVIKTRKHDLLEMRKLKITEFKELNFHFYI